MNDDAQINKELTKSTISVLDCGSGTTILDTYKNMKRIEDESETYYEGMIDVYKDIANQVRKTNDAKNLDESIVEDGMRNDYTIHLSERRVIPFEDEANKAKINFVDRLAAKIDRTLSTRDHIDKFYITGGGAKIIGKTIKKEMGDDGIEIVKQPQKSNLEGYYKFAQQLQT